MKKYIVTARLTSDNSLVYLMFTAGTKPTFVTKKEYAEKYNTKKVAEQVAVLCEFNTYVTSVIAVPVTFYI